MRASAGLMPVALYAWKLTVARAIKIATTDIPAKIHNDISTLYANCFNRLLTMIQPSGIAITIEINTGRRNSIANVYITVKESAPITFLIPTSFVRR